MNAIDWFELFVTDLDRAARFYETMLAASMRREASGAGPMALFPGNGAGVGGGLVVDPQRAGALGAIVYLNAEGKLDACLDRAVKAGGTVVMPRTSIDPNGFIATVRDLDGNLVGLHSER